MAARQEVICQQAATRSRQLRDKDDLADVYISSAEACSQ